MTPADKLEAGLIDTIAAVLELKLGLPWQEAEPAARAVADAIRAEKGEAVPVAWRIADAHGRTHFTDAPNAGFSSELLACGGTITPLYTTPPASVPVEALRELVRGLQHDAKEYTAVGHPQAGAAYARLADKLAALIETQEKP